MATANAGFRALAAPQFVMLANAALFAVGAILHLGVPLGPLAEPRIAAASVSETACAIALLAGALAPLYAPRFRAVAAAIGNVVALTGITLSVIAIALGVGPRTVSNDILCALTTGLALISIWLLLMTGMSHHRARWHLRG